MILGIGLDVVEIERFGKALARRGQRFERRVFTPREIGDCDGRQDRVLALAARFAAKEACLKALGTGWGAGVGFADVEVLRAASGRPSLELSGGAAGRAEAMGVRSTHVSLTHQPGAAAAVVVLEG